ncbi:copper resistance CopC family protein [Metabacillus sp. 84]|uniref:copper resistance CopC family protein n=1 Tax=unclassified Metabacillus TaxID=2675274 RepID=UPI003CFB81B8
MKKLMMLLVFALVAFNQTSALAHSKLIQSNPEQGATVAEKLETVSLTFNTSIEQSSTFKVLKDGKTEVAVENIQLEGDTLTGTLPEDMENGSYTVSWDIIGADGHVIKDSFEFSLNAPVEEKPAEEETEESEETPAEESQPAEETEEAPAEETQSAEETGSNNSLIIIGVLLAAAALAAIFFSMRKGRG